MNKTDEFIKDARIVHGDKYQYDKVHYIGSDYKVTITCPIHGDFSQIARCHISRGQGCHPCGIIKRNEKTGKVKLTTEEFIKRSNEKHENRYDYSETKYISSDLTVDIRCPIHGMFEQQAGSHMKSQGCQKCARKYCILGDTDIFLREAESKHKSKYDYSKYKFNGIDKKIIIICNECLNELYVFPIEHLHGQGCKNCWNDE